MEKVRSGEAVNIRASTWNAFVDAANWVREAKQNTLGAGVGSGISVASGTVGWFTTTVSFEKPGSGRAGCTFETGSAPASLLLPVPHLAIARLPLTIPISKPKSSTIAAAAISTRSGFFGTRALNCARRL